MEIAILAAAAYLAAMVLAARYLLFLPQRQDTSAGFFALAFIFLLFWPVWAPIVAFHRGKARRAEPSYLKRVAELEDLIAQDKALRMQIDELLEQLAAVGDGPQMLGLLADLAATTQAREHARSRAAAISTDAREIRSRDMQWSRPGLPEIPQGNFQDETEAEDDEGVTRVRLYLSSHSDEGDEWDRGSVSRDLQKHLFGRLPQEPDRRGYGPSRIRYMRPAPARIRTWEAVFTSSFRKSLRRADKDIELRTMAAIEDLVVNPVQARGNTIRRLTGDRKGLWRYRIGDFRLIYQPLVEQGELRLISLTHRSQAY